MRLFLQILILSLLSFSVRAQTCKDLFATQLMPTSQENAWLLKTLAASQELSENPSIWKKTFLRQKIKWYFQKIIKNHPLPEGHPGALFLQSSYLGEFYWPTTVILRVGLQTQTPYLTFAEREDLRIELRPDGVASATTQELFSSYIYGIFVIGLDGDVYIKHQFSKHDDFFRHSSFFAGAPVLFAGTISLKPDGTITFLTRQSGHYRPTREHFLWAQNYLLTRGYKLPPFVDVLNHS